MIPSPSNPVALSLGPLQIRWYGILIALGMVLGLKIAVHEAKRRNLNVNVIYDLVLWSGVTAIIGARLYYVLFNLSSFNGNVLEMFAVWHGGLAIHGAIIGGVIAFLLYAKKKNLKRLWDYLDCLILGLLTGQIIGRWGNFVNQEAFGGPTNLPWGIAIDSAHRPSEYSTAEMFHPTFLYESLWNAVTLIALLYLNKKGRLSTGMTTALYCVAYGIGRFWIESLRTDSLLLGPVKAAQIMSILLAGAGVVLLLRFRKKHDQIGSSL